MATNPQEVPDLTTYHEAELPPGEDEQEEEAQPRRDHPNAVPEGADAPEEEVEEEVEDDSIEDTLDIHIRNTFGDEQTHAVSIRGSKEAVERIKQERMLHADYTRKTTELARQRDGIADAVRQAQDQGRTQYVQQLEALKTTVLSTLEPELRSVDWQKLATEDPQEFLRLSARGQQLQSHLTHIEQEQRKAAETQAREDYNNLQRRIQESREVVMQTIPGWNDQRYSEILSSVSSRYGFSLDEVAQVIDPRIIRLMSDVTKYHQGLGSVEKRAIAKKKIAQTPKPIPAGPAPQSPRTAVTRAETTFRKTRSVADGARLLDERLSRRR